MPHEVIIHTYSQAQNIHTYSVACFFIVTYLQWFIHISMSSNALHHTMCSGMPPNISMQHSYMWRAMYWGARVQKHPEILCVPANPPSQYYDTCCCRERENITRTSLSKWSCIIFHDDKHEMDHECWLMNKYCFIYEAFVRPLALLYLIIYPILNHVLHYCRVPPCAPKGGK